MNPYIQNYQGIPSAPCFDEQQPPPLYPVYSPNYQPYVAIPFAPPKPALTQTAHTDTEKLLAKASEVSESILNRPAPKLPPYNPQQPQVVRPVITKPAAPVFNIDLSDRHWDMFNNKTEVHHHYHDGEDKDSKQKKDAAGIRLLVGVIGMTIALVTAFFIGKSVAQGEDEAEDQVGFDKLKKDWNFNKVCYEYDYQYAVEEVLIKTDAILQRKQTQRIHKIALLILSFITGGVAFTGALINSVALMIGAVALGAIIGVAALFKLGYTCFSTRDKKDAQAIENSLAELNQKDIVITG